MLPALQEKKRDAEAQLSALQGKLQELTMEKAHLETRNRRLQVHLAPAKFSSKLRTGNDVKHAQVLLQNVLAAALAQCHSHQ